MRQYVLPTLHAFALTKHEAGGVCSVDRKDWPRLSLLDERLTPEGEGGKGCGMQLKRGK